MKELENLDDLLYHEIQVLYNGENLMIKGLPRMIDKAKDPALVAAFAQHLGESKRHKETLEFIARHFGIDPKGDGNTGMKGLIAEGEKVMHIDATDEALDAALIAGVQKIEHYEISGYGTAAHYAETLGHTAIAQQLREILVEEQATDTKLNDLARTSINRKAQIARQDE